MSEKIDTQPVTMNVASMELVLGADGVLLAKDGPVSKAVRPHRCFPWTDPARFISLRAEDNREVALVQDLAELDALSRQALLDVLAQAGFLLEITRIVDLKDEFEVRVWKVQTRQGARTFQTKLDHWPVDLPNGALLIKDVAGDLYLIAAPDQLDEQSAKFLYGFID